MNSLTWSDWYCIADSAARTFSEELTRNAPHATSDLRRYTRVACVGALRALWRTGDRELRRLVISRVTVWVYSKTDHYNCTPRIKRIESRVLGPSSSQTPRSQ